MSIEIVCTDKDMHPSRVLGAIMRTPDGLQEVLTRERVTAAEERRPFPHEIDRRITLSGVTDDYDGERRWRFRCPSCNRDIVIRGGRLAAAWPKLAAAGVSRLDVSVLSSTLLL